MTYITKHVAFREVLWTSWWYMLWFPWITVFDAISCGYPKSYPSCLWCPCQPPNQFRLDVQVCLVATFGSLLPFCLAPPRWEGQVAWVASREQSDYPTKREVGNIIDSKLPLRGDMFSGGYGNKNSVLFLHLDFLIVSTVLTSMKALGYLLYVNLSAEMKQHPQQKSWQLWGKNRTLLDYHHSFASLSR